jgi:hypothetical protein
MSDTASLQEAIQRLMTLGVLGWLIPTGTAIFTIAAGIRLANAGRKMMVSGGNVMHDFYFEHLVPIAAGMALLSFWAVPIPGVGLSLPDSLTHGVHVIALGIHDAQGTSLMIKLTEFQNEMEVPGITEIRALIVYLVGNGLFWVLEGVGFIAGALAMVVTAVCILLGPLAISTMLSKNFDFIFRGWLRAFVGYATMPITIAAISFVVTNFVANVLLNVPHFSTAEYVGSAAIIIVTPLAGIIVMGASPLIHNHIVSGASGAGHGVVGSLFAGAVARLR